MPDKAERPRAPSGISRREVLTGVAVAALAATAPGVTAQPKKQRVGGSRTTPTAAPLRRYMAASAVLNDGRIVVTGGYSQPWTEGSPPQAMNSVMIFDPRNGSWSAAAPMRTQRARHAAVTLLDGRVAVLGGLGMTPTASVEIYDPRTNTWEAAEPLVQPRYDHSAVADGGFVYILGGSSNTMLSSVEVRQL